MVNGWLKSAILGVDNAAAAAQSTKRAHFRHEICVNQQRPTRPGALRSRFGSSDSWSIN
jgi:hypothetical protein